MIWRVWVTALGAGGFGDCDRLRARGVQDGFRRGSVRLGRRKGGIDLLLERLHY